MAEYIFAVTECTEYPIKTPQFFNMGELIRCKDCRFNYGIANGKEFNADDILCTYFETDGMTANDYCSQAERKEHD